MLSSNASISVIVGGVTVSGMVSRSAAGQVGHALSLAAGKAGTLTTRTTDTTGEVTLGAGHGILEADVVDLYWAGGLRYGVVVGAVAGNVVPFSLGAGDVLPDADTALVVCKQTVIDTDFDGDLVEMFAVGSTMRGHADVQESNGDSIKAIELLGGEPWLWASGNGWGTNPLAAKDVGKIAVSNGDSGSATTLHLGVLYASV